MRGCKSRQQKEGKPAPQFEGDSQRERRGLWKQGSHHRGDVLWATAALPPRRPQLPEGAAVPSLDGEFSLEGELSGRHGEEAQRCDSSFSSEFLRNGEQLQRLMMTLKRLQNPNCPLHGEKSSGHFLVLPRVFPYCSYISPLSYSGEKARGLSH